VKKKNIVLGTIIIAILGVFSTSLFRSENPDMEYVASFEPASFESGACKVSLQTLENTWTERNLDVYTPTWLPKEMKLKGIWVVGKENDLGNLAVFIYSSVNRDTIATAEIAFEVSPMDGVPFDPSNSKGVFTSINGWPVYYDECAPVFYEEYRELYGADSLLINVQMGALNYNFRGEPSLTLDDMFKVIESMRPVSTQ
jgi:hypothetical protein